MHESDELVGTDIGGFIVVRRLGAGAMGVVYEATDTTLRRSVAIKVLPESVTRDPGFRARFLREARAAAAVTHPAVATIHQIGQFGGDEGRIWIAMELVQGRTLRARLGEGPMKIDEALAIATDIARGLARAHDSGVVHRDIKPDNVMLTRDGHVKVLDFGLARWIPTSADVSSPPVSQDLTMDGRIVGTPGYMSPEQGRGAAVDGRTDVFALGVMLYEMLAGLRPFSGVTPIDAIIAAARDPHRPIETHRPDIPAPVRVVIDRCLAKAPEDRYPNAGALAEALVEARAAISGARATPLPTPAPMDVAAALAMPTLGPSTVPTPLSTPPDRPGEPTRDTLPRRRSWFPFAAVGGLVVGLAVVLITTIGPSAPTPAPSPAPEPTPTPALAPAPAPTPALAPSPTPAAPAKLLADPQSVLACPLFITEGAEEPSGWLGAAAAHLTCGRVAAMLGGAVGRTRVPAELLGLPFEPLDDFPAAPYDAPDARMKSLDAAKATAQVWVEGKIAVVGDQLRVTLTLATANGTDARSASGEGRSLVFAVRAALDALTATGAFDRAEEMSPEVARWLGLRTVDAAVAYHDAYEGGATGIGVEELVAAARPYKAEIGGRWAELYRKLTDVTELPLPDSDLPPPIDTNTDSGPMLAGLASALIDPKADRKAIADAIAEQRTRLGASAGREAIAGLTNVEGMVRYTGGEVEHARSLFLSVAGVHPRRTDWGGITMTSFVAPNAKPVLRAFAAWEPSNPDTWLELANNDRDLPTEERLKLSRRTLMLGADLPFWNLECARLALLLGQPARARSIAARLALGGPLQRSSAQIILTMLDASEGRFAAAVERVRQVLSEVKLFGRTALGHMMLVNLPIAISIALGRASVFADAFAQRFVLTEPHRLTEDMLTPILVANTCAWASKEVAAACFKTLRALVAEKHFVAGIVPTTDAYITTCERFSQGDYAGAATAWRPHMMTALPPSLIGIVFDEVGEPDIAARFDSFLMVAAPVLHGATIAHAREAKRAFARKDFARCRELATTVIEAWSVADVAVPSVAEMRKLLDRCPKP